MSNFVADSKQFVAESGFLDTRKVDEQSGKYPKEYLEVLNVSDHFKKMIERLNAFRVANPTSLKDHLKVDISKISSVLTKSDKPIQSVSSILNTFYGGSMSQGALTVTDPKTPTAIGTHETLTAAMNAIGMWSASGED